MKKVQKHINPCSVCLVAGRNLQKSRDPDAKSRLKEALKEHLDRQRQERLDYYSKRERAIKSPQQYLSMIIDGMDQSKTGVPHFKGWARPKVYLSFLMKGHTHEDIDQRFSKISHHLRRVDAMTIPTLMSEIGKSFKTPCTVNQIGTVWDVRKWISDSLNNISNHSFAHQFWIYSDSQTHVSIKARQWSTDEWYPSGDEDPIDLLLYDQYDQQCYPSGDKYKLLSTNLSFNIEKFGTMATSCKLQCGVPATVEPDFNKLDLENLKQVITKVKNHLNQEEKQCWNAFFEDPHKYSTKIDLWPLSFLEPVHRFVPLPQTMNVVTEIQEDIELERSRPKIKAKRKIRKE